MPPGQPGGHAPRFGARVGKEGIRFAVWSGAAERVWLALFDASGEEETGRLEMARAADGTFSLTVSGLKAGTRYGFRADGPYAPERGLWLDPEKLLVDPYAVEIDRPFAYSPELSRRRGEGGDTAKLVPKAIAWAAPEPVSMGSPIFEPGGFIYELSVRAFTMRHPDIEEKIRGTIGALAHPTAIRHLKKIGVSAVELMPVTAWIDERHLPPLGLSNSWGYNPVTLMALDPRLAPGGVAELRSTVAALREAGIGTILDLVFNHTGESDAQGPTLSMRGLDSLAYYRHQGDGPVHLVNDTGTGNTLACDHPIVEELVLDALRHFVLNTGVDGFRFDLAPVLGRTADGFDRKANLLLAIHNDPVLKDRVMIAEPWDIGHGGYQLGNFPNEFLEWNDKYRDDIRRFWRGDHGMVGALATRLAGSSDVFRDRNALRSRSVNFIAAHDGATLADLVSYERKHNEANGEQNRDGHNENLSWNNGVEGETDDPQIAGQRRNDARALLATLFASRGTIMLTAGDEFGRTQRGNNNAYAQDNAITWLDWAGRDTGLEDFVAALAAMRKDMPALADTHFLTGDLLPGAEVVDVEWLSETGAPMKAELWEEHERRRLTMVVGNASGKAKRLAVMINGDRADVTFALPVRAGHAWERLATTDEDGQGDWQVTGRSIAFAAETIAKAKGKG
ncbi:MAG: glycogen debranching protein GlgX [Alphaproteobacteria bacterium]|nr:glycogen debranching protein GlgX [Alphaproteobacteria bacterium]